MNRTQKEKEVVTMKERLEAAKVFVFAGYRGLKVAQISDLRRKLRKNAARLKVVKNRLAKRTLDDKGLSALANFVVGPTAVATSDGDAVQAIKVLIDFAKDNERFELRGGYLEGQQITRQQLEALAKLPSREALLARVFGSMKSPASNLVGVLWGVPRKLVTVINAIKETKSS